MTLIVLKILSHMVTFAVGQLPIIMLAFYKRLNFDYKYDYQSILRVIPISVVLIIVSVYKMVYLAVFSYQNPVSQNTNVSLFFAIGFITCVFLSIYFILDRAITHINAKSKKIALNASAGATILLAIFTIFLLVSQSQVNGLSYIDLAMNFIYPVLTGILALSGIITLIAVKKSSKSQRIYSIIFISCIPLIILDIFFAEKMQILLTCVPYILYIIVVFYEVFSSASDEKTIVKDSKIEFKKKYQLTEREMEVYALASQGLSNQEISKKLYVSIHTVKTHLQHIFAKLNISTRYQLINFEKEHSKSD